MANVKFNSNVGTAIVQAIATALDAGGVHGYMEMYSGVKPNSPNVAVSNQVKLGTLNLAYPCGTVTTKTLTFGPITRDNAADATGTASWVRFYDSDNVPVVDVDVGDELSSAGVKLGNIYVIEGMPIVMNSVVISIA